VGETRAQLLVHLPEPLPPVERIPLEAVDVAEYLTRRATEPRVHMRTEAELVRRYAGWLQRTRKTQAERHRIPSPGGAPLFTDVYDPSRRLLIEAKASASRNDVRTALGQILDYARSIEHDHKAVLLPSQPPRDLEVLLAMYGVGIIWPETGGRFVERLV
jgi:hypothetical protein